MKKPQQPQKAVVVSAPQIHLINDEGESLAYEAEMQYVRKPNEIKLILCSPDDDIRIGQLVDLVYNRIKRAYQHKYSCLSNTSNTFGGFYYTNGRPA